MSEKNTHTHTHTVKQFNCIHNKFVENSMAWLNIQNIEKEMDKCEQKYK